MLAWCPESPVWLEGIGNKDAADTACLKLWGVHALVPEPDYEADLNHVAASSAAAAAAAGGGLQQPLLLSGSAGTSSKSSSILGLAATSSPSRRLQQPVTTAASMAWDSPRYATAAGAGGIAAAGAGGTGGWDSSSSYGSLGLGMRSASSEMGWGEEGGGGVGGGFKAQGQGSRAAGGWDCLLERQNRWMMLLALGLPLLQQASGINTVVYYSSQVRGWIFRACLLLLGCLCLI